MGPRTSGSWRELIGAIGGPAPGPRRLHGLAPGGEEGPSSRYVGSETSTGETQVQNHKNWKGVEWVSKIIF